MRTEARGRGPGGARRRAPGGVWGAAVEGSGAGFGGVRWRGPRRGLGCGRGGADEVEDGFGALAAGERGDLVDLAAVGDDRVVR
ncbi:hypothetical protein ABZS87_22275, partial [Streptomyces sp. NPDC005336]